MMGQAKITMKNHKWADWLAARTDNPYLLAKGGEEWTIRKRRSFYDNWGAHRPLPTATARDIASRL